MLNAPFVRGYTFIVLAHNTRRQGLFPLMLSCQLRLSYARDMNKPHALKIPNEPTAPDSDVRDCVAKMDAISRAAIKTPDGKTQYTNVWQATLRRQGQRISRTFAEARWSGREPALTAARAWRDAVTEAIPPITNHQAATRLAARNTTGMSGVCRNEPNGNPNEAMWTATLTTPDGLKRRAFTVSAYGEEDASRRAIVQRQEWLNQLPPRYLSMCQTSRDALEHLPAPTTVPSVEPVPLLTHKEIKARVAIINTNFDARMPKRLRWRVRAQNAARPNGPLVVVNSDTNSSPRRHVRTVCPNGRSLDAMLTEAIAHLRTDVTGLHGKKIADWFIRTHAATALSPAQFDPVTGFKGCVMIPKEADIGHPKL